MRFVVRGICLGSAVLICGLWWSNFARPAAAQTVVAANEPATAEASIVDASGQVLHEIMAIPAKAIPTSLLRDAKAIVIVPGMGKAGLVIGVRHGRGILVVRDTSGAWRVPTFLTVTGGSVGWQVGVQSTDLVLVFKTNKSVESLLNGKFTIGADVSAAAGPLGRDASLGTDLTLQTEVYSYSRSRGLFAGAALDGSMLQVDDQAAQAYYQSARQAGGANAIPPSANRFMSALVSYVAGNSPDKSRPAGTVGAAAAAPSQEAVAVRQQLADASQKMLVLVDQQWKTYLALPAEVYQPQAMPTVESLAVTINRYQRVAADPQYQVLIDRQEFQQTLQGMQQLLPLLAQPTVSLPPPPQN